VGPLGLVRSRANTVVAALPSAVAGVPVGALREFGRGVAARRRTYLAEATAGTTMQSLDTANVETDVGMMRGLVNRAVAANVGFDFNVGATPVGILNLERVEMAPAGIERGELIATIPLAPLEETAVTAIQWLVISREFTSIVTDSLENYSETGVTDNTELAQSTTSQLQHSNQFNITGTVKGGIPLISGSVIAGCTTQDASSLSHAESRFASKAGA
jgi:hypothetical protein